MHAHKWKREATEAEATIKEIRRKASRIAPAYNKHALRYLPDDSRTHVGFAPGKRTFAAPAIDG
jgi:hypothetical protein